MAIIKFILFAVLLYYLAKSVVRLLFPVLLKNFANKVNTANNQYVNNKKEGEVSIKYTKKDQKIDKDIGDYTDFEEIKDE